MYVCSTLYVHLLISTYKYKSVSQRSCVTFLCAHTLSSSPVYVHLRWRTGIWCTLNQLYVVVVHVWVRAADGPKNLNKRLIDWMRIGEQTTETTVDNQRTNEHTLAHNLLRETLNGCADEKPEIQYACLLCALVNSKMPANLFYNSFFFFLCLNFAFNKNTFFVLLTSWCWSFFYCFFFLVVWKYNKFRIKIEALCFFTLFFIIYKKTLSIFNTYWL